MPWIIAVTLTVPEKFWRFCSVAGIRITTKIFTNEDNEANEAHEASDSKSSSEEALYDCPIFLRKTYFMIDTCDTSIAQWSADGKSFLIKEPDTFASEIIPQFFKHNNLQSFVRQLNFYGFRKMKSVPLKFDDTVAQKHKYICFRHENFLRDRPDLILLIRKSRQATAPDHQEVQALRDEVDTLKNCISSMTSEIEALKSITHKLIEKIDDSSKFGASKRKYERIGENDHIVERKCKIVQSDSSFSKIPPPLSPSIVPSNKKELSDVDTQSLESPATDMWHMEEWPNDGEVFDSMNEDDSDLIKSLLSEKEDNVTPAVSELKSVEKLKCLPKLGNMTGSSGIALMGEKYMLKLYESISLLPHDVRHLFTVDQLFLNITDPECMKKQVDALEALATDLSKQPTSSRTTTSHTISQVSSRAA